MGVHEVDRHVHNPSLPIFVGWPSESWAPRVAPHPRVTLDMGVRATATTGVGVMAAATFGQPLWSQWGIAAAEQRAAASLAREDLVREWPDGPWHLASQREMRHAMQAIVASSFAIEGWAFACRGEGAGTATPGSAGSTGALKEFYVLDRPTRKDLVHRIEELFLVHRNQMVHHRSPSRDGVVHPVLGNTPYESGTYTVEAADRACETVRLVIAVSLQHAGPIRPPDPVVAGHAQMVATALGW